MIRPLLRSLGVLVFAALAAVLVLLVAIVAAGGVVGCGCYLAVFGSRRAAGPWWARLAAIGLERFSNGTQ